MADSREHLVDLGRGLHLQSPVLVASGTFGYGFDAPLVDRRALGAIVTKGTTLRAREGNPPTRIAETASGMLNAIGLQNPGVEHVASTFAPAWATWPVPVIVNVAGESIEEYRAIARRLSGVAGVAGLELNISCPNVALGLQFGVDPRLAGELTAAVRAVTPLPLMVKLTPNVTDIRRGGACGGRRRGGQHLGDQHLRRPGHRCPAGQACARTRCRRAQWTGDQATGVARGLAGGRCRHDPGGRDRRHQ